MCDTESETEYFSCSSGPESESDNEDEHKIYKNVKIVSISTGLLFINKQYIKFNRKSLF